jgi:hypothetical protein
VTRRAGALGLAVAALLTAFVDAQRADVARPAISGTWQISDANAGGEKVADQVEVVPAGGAPTGGTGATDGAGSGVTGGRGGFVPGAADPGQSGRIPMLGLADWGSRLPSTKPKRLSPAEALRKEISTPAEELLISLAADSVTIGDGISPSIQYKTNAKTEGHQLVNGSVKTKTMWEGGVLRQDIDGGRDFAVRRVFELLDSGQLRVTFAPQSSWKLGASLAGVGGPAMPVSNVRHTLYKRKPQ